MIEKSLVCVQQPEVLVAAAKKSGIQHGTDTLVNIDNVKVYPLPENIPAESRRRTAFEQMRFCSCSVTPKTVLQGCPDQQEMSEEVFLIGKIRVPQITKETRPRTFRIENIILSSNGRTELHTTKKTRFVRTDNQEHCATRAEIELVVTD